MRMGTRLLTQAIITMLFLWIYKGDIVHSISPGVECQIMNDTEETDPDNRDLFPEFVRLSKCKGGSRARNGYQCQGDMINVTVKAYKISRNLVVDITMKAAASCKEVCICGRRCNDPKPGICGRGYRWDAKDCKCICNDKVTTGYRGSGGEKITRMRFLSLFLGLSITFTILFAVAVSLFQERKIQKDRKYRLLPKVRWNKETNREIKEYLLDVDGDEERSTICCLECCPRKSRPQRNRNNGDEEDAGPDQNDPLTTLPNENERNQAGRTDNQQWDRDKMKKVAKDLPASKCFDMGYQVFYRNNFCDMLFWMRQANEKWIMEQKKEVEQPKQQEQQRQQKQQRQPRQQKQQRQPRQPRQSERQIDFEKRLYIYLSFAYLAARNFEKAKEFMEKALRKRPQAKDRSNGNIRLSEDPKTINGSPQHCTGVDTQL